MEGNIVEKAQVMLLFRQAGIPLLESLELAGIPVTDALRERLLAKPPDQWYLYNEGLAKRRAWGG